MTSHQKIEIAKLLGDREVIAFRPVLARALGSVTATLFLCQAIYWQGVAGDGIWWYKLRDAQRDAGKKMLAPTDKRKQSWEWETGLTRAQQQAARALLRELGLLDEELHGIPARMHFRVNLSSLKNFLTTLGSCQQDGETQPTGMQDPADLTERSNRQDSKKQLRNTKSKHRLPDANNNSGRKCSVSPSTADCAIVFEKATLHPTPRQHDIPKNSNIFQRLKSHGIGMELATKWILLDENRTIEVIDYVEERILKSLLRSSPAGYIRTLIENPSASFGKTEFTKNFDTEKQQKKQAAEKADAKMKGVQATTQERANRVKIAIKALDPRQRQQYSQQYVKDAGAAHCKSYDSQNGDFKDAKERIMFTGWLHSKVTLVV